MEPLLATKPYNQNVIFVKPGNMLRLITKDAYNVNLDGIKIVPQVLKLRALIVQLVPFQTVQERFNVFPAKEGVL